MITFSLVLQSVLLVTSLFCVHVFTKNILAKDCNVYIDLPMSTAMDNTTDIPDARAIKQFFAKNKYPNHASKKLCTSFMNLTVI